VTALCARREAISNYIVNLVRRRGQHAAVWVGAGREQARATVGIRGRLAALDDAISAAETLKELDARFRAPHVVRPEFEMEAWAARK